MRVRNMALLLVVILLPHAVRAQVPELGTPKSEQFNVNAESPAASSDTNFHHNLDVALRTSSESSRKWRYANAAVSLAVGALLSSLGTWRLIKSNPRVDQLQRGVGVMFI